LLGRHILIHVSALSLGNPRDTQDKWVAGGTDITVTGQFHSECCAEAPLITKTLRLYIHQPISVFSALYGRCVYLLPQKQSH